MPANSSGNVLRENTFCSHVSGEVVRLTLRFPFSYRYIDTNVTIVAGGTIGFLPLMFFPQTPFFVATVFHLASVLGAHLFFSGDVVSN